MVCGRGERNEGVRLLSQHFGVGQNLFTTNRSCNQLRLAVTPIIAISDQASRGFGY